MTTSVCKQEIGRSKRILVHNRSKNVCELQRGEGCMYLTLSLSSALSSSACESWSLVGSLGGRYGYGRRVSRVGVTTPVSHRSSTPLVTFVQGAGFSGKDSFNSREA